MLHLVSLFEHMLSFIAWSATRFLYVQKLTAIYSGDTRRNACEQWGKVKMQKLKALRLITLRDQLIGHKIFALSKNRGHQSATYPLVLRFGKSGRSTTMRHL